MKIHGNVPLLLIASSLAGGAFLAGCGADAPGQRGDLDLAPNGPVLVETDPAAAPVEGVKATTFTQAEDSSTFGVYIRQGDTARKIQSVKVQGHVNEVTVESHATPAGDRVAIVPNYDTFAGTELRVVETGADRAERVLESARVASPVWSPDGAELAYLAMQGNAFDVRLSDGIEAGRTIGTIEALRAKILGWAKDQTELYVIMDIDQQKGPPLVAFGVINVATGALQTTFASDAESSTFYRDFQLVDTEDGSQLISFVKATTQWPCGGTSRLQLATVNGTLLADHGETTDSYSQVRFSSDGKQVTYEVRACADKKLGLEKAQQRMEAINGIHVAEVGEKGSKRIASGLLRDFRLSSLRDGGVELGSSTRGLNVVKAADTVLDLPTLEADFPGVGSGDMSMIVPQKAPTTNAKNVTAQYVHQLWDTPDWFNGNSACGPASSVMDLAGYQLGAWPMQVSWPNAHTSQYGQYVAAQYTYNGYTFSTATKDPSGNWAKGAYGHMVKDPNVGSTWAFVTSYLDIHVPWAVAEASGNIGAAWVKSQLNANLMVVTSGSVFGYGHLILIRGYTDDGRWYVNDPYGYQVSGNYNGANVIYTWANISPSHFWAA
jgi:hypothetical protein